MVSTNLGPPLGGFDEIFDGSAAAGFTQVVASYSLVRDNTGTSLAPGNPNLNGNLIGTAASPIDAQLGPLGNAGGPTLTMVPANSSPVINAGDPLFTSPPFGDQRQLPYQRVNGIIDMGAVEVQPPPPDVDFNNDGIADCSDVDSLVAVIVAGNNLSTFDLNGDGLVNRADLTKWLDDAPDYNGLAITEYLPADANLDTVVDISDFNIWNSNKFSVNPAFCRGDFNANGVIDISDFNIWNQYKFTESPPQSGCGLFGAVVASTSPQHPTVPMEIEMANSTGAELAALSATVKTDRELAVDNVFQGWRAEDVDFSDGDEDGATQRGFHLLEVLGEWDSMA